MGEIALVVFCLVSLPGIFRRFGHFNKPVSIVMIFRRQLGIAMYLFAVIHLAFNWAIPVAARVFPLFPIPTFAFFGIASAILLFFLFITSNDLSVNKLGIWWNRIHSLLYIVLWLVFLHTMLQRVSIWSITIGITAASEVASFVFAKSRRKIETS